MPGCAYHVTPPADVKAPATVYLIDLGYHASIALPAKEAISPPPSPASARASRDGRAAAREVGYVEFAYGQWNWYALNHDEWYRAPGVLLIPQPAALARQSRAILYGGGTPAAEALRTQLPAEHVWPIVVEAAAAERLLERLEARWRLAAGEHERNAIYNEKVDLNMAPAGDEYWYGHNCNTVVAEWLRELGCTVTGGGLDAIFVIE